MRELLGGHEHGRTDFSLSCCDRRVGARLAINQTAYPSSKASVGGPALRELSGDPEYNYFADGVVDDIITALSRFTSFAVIARNSSFVYKGRAVDVRQVANNLGVRYVLEGSLRRSGERLRITAQLVNCSTGAYRGRNISTGRWPTSSRSRIASRPTWR